MKILFAFISLFLISCYNKNDQTIAQAIYQKEQQKGNVLISYTICAKKSEKNKLTISYKAKVNSKSPNTIFADSIIFSETGDGFLCPWK